MSTGLLTVAPRNPVPGAGRLAVVTSMRAACSPTSRSTCSVGSRRAASWVLAVFCVLATALAGLGIFGVLVHAVSERTREIALRMALGGSRGAIVGLVLRQAALPVAAGLQATLERIAFHVIGHYQQLTGERTLCLSGGVVHNCTMNGKLLYSGLFDRVFALPVAEIGLGMALDLLRQINARGLSPDQVRLAKKIAARAHTLQAAGEVELDDGQW